MSYIYCRLDENIFDVQRNTKCIISFLRSENTKFLYYYIDIIVRCKEVLCLNASTYNYVYLRYVNIIANLILSVDIHIISKVMFGNEGCSKNILFLYIFPGQYFDGIDNAGMDFSLEDLTNIEDIW